MRVAARLAGLLLLLPLAWAAHAQEPPENDVGSITHEVQVQIDPVSGMISTQERISGDGSLIVFDPADWISRYEIRHNGDLLVFDNDPPHIILEELASGTVTIQAQWSVPEQTDQLANAGNGPDGMFLFDHAEWLATSPGATSRYHLTITVPADYRAVATGDFLSEQIGAMDYAVEFLFEDPEDGPSIFVGPYLVQERQRDDLRLRTYFHPEAASLAGAYLDATEGFIRRYAALIGPYPYEGFSVVSAPIPVGLGFNSLTYVSKDILPSDYMLGRSLAHEVLHSWWGNAVRVDYATGNWAEGLTSYQADYALAEDAGEAEARDMRLEWLRSLTSLSVELDVPVRDFRTVGHGGNQAIGYNKAAMIFHMLRHDIGEQAFQAGISSFYAEYRSVRAGWSDMQAAFEKTTGRSLDGFFNQWLNRAGLPEISIADVSVRAAEQGHEITLSLLQTEPAYALRLPVRIETDAGAELLDVEMAEAAETFVIMLEHRPRALAVDPDFDVARELVAGEQVPILRDVLFAPEPIVVILSQDAAVQDAARDLASGLLRRPVDGVAPEVFGSDARAALVIGLTEDVAQWSAQNLPDPKMQRRAGTARAWTTSAETAAPRLFLSADSAEALATAFGALRYYGNRSFVVFDDHGLADAGVWTSDASALKVMLD